MLAYTSIPSFRILAESIVAHTLIGAHSVDTLGINGTYLRKKTFDFIKSFHIMYKHK
jgi:hypothetical protein